MEQFLAAAIAELVKYGLPGLFIAYLIWKVRQLEVDNEAKSKRIEALLEKGADQAIISTNASNALAGSNEKVAEALDRLDDRLEKIESRIERSRQ